jgi:hypothetical protein
VLPATRVPVPLPGQAGDSGKHVRCATANNRTIEVARRQALVADVQDASIKPLIVQCCLFAKTKVFMAGCSFLRIQ